MGHVVIAVYRPHSGREDDLLALVREHVPMLRGLGLATERPVMAMRARDGTIVEIFEWHSAQAVERAHEEPEVQALWERFGAVCSWGRLVDLWESRSTFAHFEAIDL
jgi:quinol monooxygenase YgiN